MTLYVAGILSANLALVNVLPFPPLDGGRMLVLAAQGDPALRPADLAAGGAADLRDRVRGAVHVPDLDHGVRHRAPGGRHLAGPRRRCGPRGRPTVSVDVGGVLVGSAHPVVVQSMTNTDTADADATALQVARLAHAGSQLVRVTVNTDAAAAAVPEMIRKLRDNLGVDVAGHRRLPLQRPQAAGRLPGDGGGARQVPDQPGQRRDEAPRRALPDDRPGRHRARQAGPDRRQLGLPRPAAPDRPHGGERPPRGARRRPRRDDRRHDRVGDALRGAGRGDGPAATTGSSCRRRCRASATSSTPTGGWRRAPTTRSTSA